MDYNITIEILKAEKRVVITTDYIFKRFKLYKFEKYFHLNFRKNELESMGSALMFNKFGGKKHYPSEMTVLSVNGNDGTVILSYK